jgi:exodeoxyribonuclease VII large subunit
MAAGSPPSNIPELSVSELAFSLKRTLEDTYGRIRVRGELSKVKIHSSGHLYSDLKDADSVINVVCWRGSLARLSVRPEEGLEVICTGKITTYPARSNYQLVIDHMELAGQGALLKMLEDRRKKLAAEGLFDESRKKSLPALPRVIGVVTSPTGAVIRDIIHRLNDRFPSRVIVWPVPVQGPTAANEIAAAIKGFCTLPTTGPLPRPDLLIVARGGGSLEDLMPFNEEIVVRAAAECTIPLISAVGHETDTTLIDFAADRRAPTPTAAAEMAVPERLPLLAYVQDMGGRTSLSLQRILGEQRQRLATLRAQLGDPQRLIELKIQRFDHLCDRLSHALQKEVQHKRQALLQTSSRLPHPRQTLTHAAQLLDFQRQALVRLAPRIGLESRQKLERASHLLDVLSFRSTLRRGFAVIRSDQGGIVTAASQATAAQHLNIEFSDGLVKTRVE